MIKLNERLFYSIVLSAVAIQCQDRINHCYYFLLCFLTEASEFLRPTNASLELHRYLRIIGYSVTSFVCVCVCMCVCVCVCEREREREREKEKERERERDRETERQRDRETDEILQS